MNKMKTLFTKDLQQKSIKQLVELRKDLKKELFSLKSKNTMKALKQTHMITLARKNVARVNTALSSKIIEKNGDNR